MILHIDKIGSTATIGVDMHVVIVLPCLLAMLSACHSDTAAYAQPSSLDSIHAGLNQKLSPPRDRGQQWVRSHPFTIMGLVRTHPRPFDLEQYRRAGFNALLAWEPGSFDYVLPMAAAAGVPFHVNLTSKDRWGHDTTNRPDSTDRSLREA